ncbi:AMP-binding protein [Pseudalkalibacillus decolorationis]|uniref:AMP-binding protein n=1 Tax=Pseudalkalibacillus decolorationis TaxID=163879 RepID=UPI002147CE3E|nr:AMP-binding protein [Pseudalkalibacillus decolorationis]
MYLSETIGQLLKDKVNRFPNREAVVYSKEEIRHTYKEFYELTGKVAKGLMALGIKKGEHIAVWSTNRFEWLLLQFGSARMGAVLVTVNTNYQQSELDYLLKQSDTTTLFMMDQFRTTSYVDIVKSLLGNTYDSSGKVETEKLPYLRQLIFMETETPDGLLGWQAFIELSTKVSDEELAQREDELHHDDVINMQYTSGTTGFPKGVMLTHYNIVNNGFQVASAMNLTEEDRLCIPVPFFHCFGCVLGVLACVSVGATMVPIDQFDPDLVLWTVEREKCTGLHGVPTMFIAELNLDSFDDYNLSTLRTGIMAGSPCPIEVMKKVINLMGMDEITIAYGQTESSPVITQTRKNDPIERRVETVGKRHPVAEVKIVDPVTSEGVPTGIQGELCTRGYLVMKGYYKMPEATSNAIDSEGWLHTGDLAVLDVEGYIKITGRLKDMIIRGGENVYPREIEEFLYTHPDIVDVQVIGIPDEKYGEKVAACVQVKENECVSVEAIKSYCQGKISKHKIPEHIFIVKEYPMTASGKIQKFKLIEQAQKWASESI